MNVLIGINNWDVGGAENFVAPYNLQGVNQNEMYKLFSRKYYYKLIVSQNYSVTMFIKFMFNKAMPFLHVNWRLQFKYVVKTVLNLFGILTIVISNSDYTIIGNYEYTTFGK